MRFSFTLALLAATPALALAQAPAPALADEPMLYVSGPDACALVAQAGGDGGPIHRLTPEHMILDYEKIWGGGEGCDFDTAITLDPSTGAESVDGICDRPDGGETRGTFTVVYGDADAEVHFEAATSWTRSFVLCPFL